VAETLAGVETVADLLAVCTGELTPGVAARSGPFPFERVDGAQLDTTNLTLLSRDLDGASPYFSPFVPIGVAEVSRVCTALEMEPVEVVRRWRALGFTVHSTGARHLRAPELQVLSRDLDGEAPWWSSTMAFSASHCLTVAARSALSLDEVCDLFLEMGYEIEDPRTALPVRRPGDAS
jgi:hypothetical protein